MLSCFCFTRCICNTTALLYFDINLFVHLFCLLINTFETNCIRTHVKTKHAKTAKVNRYYGFNISNKFLHVSTHFRQMLAHVVLLCLAHFSQKFSTVSLTHHDYYQIFLQRYDLCVLALICGWSQK